MLHILMFTIGKVAGLAQISTDTLRHYERKGLLKPANRNGSGYRLYDQDSLRRIRFIRRAQKCGFTLAEISRLIVLRGCDAACCGDMRRRTIEKKLQIEKKIKAMKSISEALDGLIADCIHEEHPVEECPIIAALEQTEGPSGAH